MNTKITTREYALIAALAAISAVMELIHVGYQLPQFGMWIDAVAITWIMAFFLFGIRAALLTATIGAIIITLFAPSSWLGASMKWVATVPIALSLFFWLLITKKQLSYYAKISNLFMPLVLGILLRIILVIPLNYYYAIPIWTGLTSKEAFIAIPWLIIVVFNVIQAIIDVGIAWVLVFRFNLKRFASWE